jgi:CubicO group peptidase (beta-lactamase class C family)
MKIVFFVLFACCFGQTSGQTPPPLSRLVTDSKYAGKTDSVVQRAAQAFMAVPQAVGLSVGVYQEGKLQEYHFGETAKGSGNLPTSNSLYGIASLTKTFTATLLAQAVVEKRVALQDDIRGYLEGTYPNLEYQGQPIRLVHLVNHNSGLPFLLPEIPEILTDQTLSYTDIARKINRPLDRQAFFQALQTVKLDTIPGARSRYSNAAVQLLSFILEKVYKIPYEKLLGEKILQPLQMPSTRFVFRPDKEQRLVKAYDEQGNTIPANTSSFGAAGGLSSTVGDMLRYVRWQAEEKEDALRLAHRPTVGDFNPYAVGLNWQMLRKGNIRLLWQDGNMIGYSSLCVLYPELDLGFVVLTNQMDRTSAQRIVQMINQVTRAIAPQAIPLP